MNLARFAKYMQGMPGGLRLVVDFGGARYNVNNVTKARNGGAIIEVGNGDNEMTCAGLLAELLNFETNTFIELFIKHGDDYGYYNIHDVLHQAEYVRILVGSFIEGNV